MPQEIRFTPATTLKPKPDESNLGFGKLFTDYMFTMVYDRQNGWHNPEIRPFAPFSLDPATIVLHYGQEIFEGLKAYRTPDGAVDYSKDFFGKRASLTVSGQLNCENFALAFGSVYTFGPTFRAENSNTARHAAEFWMIEPEMAFADLNDYMNVAEDMIKYIIRFVMDRCPDEMDFFNSFVDKGLRERLEHVASSDFGRLTYTKAVEILKEHNDQFDYPVEWGCDLQTEHERYLTEKIYKKPVFVTDYPKEIKAFYMRMNDDNKTVAAADCLVPGIGEIIGGSQREERLDLLEGRIKELGMTPEDYWWYCDLRRYGSCKHAGFGLGFERMVMYLTGVSNIRDVLPHPRTVGSADF